MCEPTKHNLAVYVGPTLSTGKVSTPTHRASNVLWLPPIARGDLPQLPDNIKSVLIVDGYFGERPSVSHLEILECMKTKRVYGCSSMGAIRAFELRHDGMEGRGQVYQSFFLETDFMDDEVALYHAPEPFFWPLSLPLVNVRVAMQNLYARGWVTSDQARDIIDKLKAMYFGYRTAEALFSLLQAKAVKGSEAEWYNVLSCSDIKYKDCVEALRELVSDDDKHLEGNGAI